MHSTSSAHQSEVKAWEEVILPGEHTLTLQQYPIYSLDMTHFHSMRVEGNPPASTYQWFFGLVEMNLAGRVQMDMVLDTLKWR